MFDQDLLLQQLDCAGFFFFLLLLLPSFLIIALESVHYGVFTCLLRFGAFFLFFFWIGLVCQDFTSTKWIE